MSISTSLRALAPIARRTNQLLRCKSPAIFLAAGITGGVVASLLAVKNTPAVIDAKKSFKKSIDTAEKCHKEGSFVDKEDKIVPYSETVYRNDVKIILGRKYFAYLKAYGPSIIIGTLSILSLLASHRIMMARNAALTATVASISEAFKRYRHNVRREFGDEVDYNMRHSLVTEKMKVTEEDPVTGKKITRTKNVSRLKEDLPWRSDYARPFDENALHFTTSPSSNAFQLNTAETLANQKLAEDGFLFLNDVFEMFGWPKTLVGSEMGWIYPRGSEVNEYGDGFVDFGFRHDADFMAGKTPFVWLDFNVDDKPIRDRIKWYA